jgi:endogenous inhibitor of DNA gyrase (YacG/DUF329 family)
MYNMRWMGTGFMKCALCSRPTVKEFAPFCSKICQQHDLLHWLQGRYCIPGDEPAIDPDAPIEEEDDD